MDAGNPKKPLQKIPLFFLPVIALWLAVAVYSLADPAKCVFPDSDGYLKLAANLLQNRTFTMSSDSPFVPETFRLPGYPLFLALFKLLFGSSIGWIIATQMVLGFLAIPMMLRTISKWSSPAALRIGFLLWGCDVVYVFTMPAVLSETLFVSLLVAAIAALIRTSESKTTLDTFVSGVLCGCAMLVRPAAIFFPLVSSLMFLNRKRLLVLFLMASYMLPAAWCYRNQRLVGHFQLTSQGGYDLLRYPASMIMGFVEDKSREEEEEILRRRADSAYGTEWPDMSARSKAYGKLALEIFKEHPVLFLKVNAIGAVRILTGTGLELITNLFVPNHGAFVVDSEFKKSITGQGTRRLLRHFPWLAPVLIVYAAMVGSTYLFFLVGVVSLVRAGRFTIAYLLFFGAIYFLAVASHQGMYRYRIPMVPFLIAGACVGLAKNKKWS